MLTDRMRMLELSKQLNTRLGDAMQSNQAVRRYGRMDVSRELTEQERLAMMACNASTAFLTDACECLMKLENLMLKVKD